MKSKRASRATFAWVALGLVTSRLSTKDHNWVSGCLNRIHLWATIFTASMAVTLRPQPSAKPVVDGTGGPTQFRSLNLRLIATNAALHPRKISGATCKWCMIFKTGTLGRRLKHFTKSITPPATSVPWWWAISISFKIENQTSCADLWGTLPAQVLGTNEERCAMTCRARILDHVR